MFSRGVIRNGLSRVPRTKLGPLFRSFSAVKPNHADHPPVEQADMVKAAVKTMLNHGEAPKASNTGEHLDQRYHDFMDLLRDARLCITDCEEPHTDIHMLREETKQAAEAVEDAFAEYRELVDDMRGFEGDLPDRFGTIREEMAADLKTLRHELDTMLLKVM